MIDYGFGFVVYDLEDEGCGCLVEDYLVWDIFVIWYIVVDGCVDICCGDCLIDGEFSLYGFVCCCVGCCCDLYGSWDFYWFDVEICIYGSFLVVLIELNFNFFCYVIME